jgi:hypothetical protein
VYFVGAARQASDFSVITEFIINHVRKTFEYGNDIANALDARSHIDFITFMPQLQESQSGDKAAAKREDQQYRLLYEAEIKRFVERKGTYESNLDKAFAVIWAQCNKSMQNKLLTKTNFESEIKGEPIKLLSAIEEFSMSYLEHQYDAVIVLDALKNFLLTKQKDEEGLVDYTRRFKSSRDVLESHVGGKMEFIKMAKTEVMWSDTDLDKQKACLDQSYQRLIALLYLQNSEQRKYGSVLNGLASQFALKQNQYPRTLTHAMSILSDHKFDPKYNENKKRGTRRMIRMIRKTPKKKRKKAIPS